MKWIMTIPGVAVLMAGGAEQIASPNTNDFPLQGPDKVVQPTSRPDRTKHSEPLSSVRKDNLVASQVIRISGHLLPYCPACKLRITHT